VDRDAPRPAANPSYAGRRHASARPGPTTVVCRRADAPRVDDPRADDLSDDDLSDDDLRDDALQAASHRVCGRDPAVGPIPADGRVEISVYRILADGRTEISADQIPADGQSEISAGRVAAGAPRALLPAIAISVRAQTTS
jgi:hypothetical protein